MIPLDTMTVYFVASLALAIAPGPDNIFVLTQSVVHGRAAGLLVTLGLCTGLMVHTAAVTLGIAVIFMTSELAFTGLKVLGAAYLLYLAWQAFRAGRADLARPHAGNTLSARKLYARGIIMNVTNPKVAIFFMAFLPQFADPARGSLTMQIIIFGALFMLATLLVFGSVAWGAAIIGAWLKTSERAQLILNWLAGTVFAALAIRLVSIQR